MLAEENRLRRAGDFRLALRGRRAARPTVVAHLVVPIRPDASLPPAAPSRRVRDSEVLPAARIGFIVSRAVGGAVTRNRVRRRLRHLLADRLERLPAGSLMVLRATPAAATAPRAALRADVDAVLQRVLPPAAPGTGQ